jgi:hypothetical protein
MRSRDPPTAGRATIASRVSSSQPPLALAWLSESLVADDRAASQIRPEREPKMPRMGASRFSHSRAIRKQLVLAASTVPALAHRREARTVGCDHC